MDRLTPVGFVDWFRAVEGLIQAVIQSSYPRYWYEDFLSMRILQEFETKISRLEVHEAPIPLRVAWDSFKATGELETKLGDIAIIVRITERDGSSLEGIACLEAKKVDRESQRFTGIRQWSQIERMRSLVPRHYLLLYDYEAISGAGSGVGSQLFCKDCYNKVFKDSSVACLSSEHALKLKARNRSLYRYSTPFSYQLCSRFLQGFDLNFHEEAIEAAKGFSASIGGPKFLLVVSVDFEIGADVEIPVVEINRQAYESFSYWDGGFDPSDGPDLTELSGEGEVALGVKGFPAPKEETENPEDEPDRRPEGDPPRRREGRERRREGHERHREGRERRREGRELRRPEGRGLRRPEGRERNAQLRERNAQPRERNAQPRERNAQPRERNAQPRERNAQPRERPAENPETSRETDREWDP